VDLMVRSIAENPGNVIAWSDVDIRIFDLTPESLAAELDALQCDILFQRESPRMEDVNTGFFVCRCTPSVVHFFQLVLSELELRPEENEQMVVNRLLLQDDGVRNGQGEIPDPAVTWKHLPLSFYARTHGWPPPGRLSIYHANYTKGPDAIAQKMSQFGEIENIRNGGFPAWSWSVIKRLPGKLLNLRVPR